MKSFNETEYKYKDIQIISLGCPKGIYNQTVYILNKDDLPILSYSKASESDIKKYDLKEIIKSLHLYLSVLKIKDNKEIVNTEILKEQGVNEDMYSFFTAIWRPQVTFKSNFNMVRINIKYIGLDEGICTNMDEIESFKNF